MAWMVRVKTDDGGITLGPGRAGQMVSRADSKEDAIIEAAQTLGLPGYMLEAVEYHIEGFKAGEQADGTFVWGKSSS